MRMWNMMWFHIEMHKDFIKHLYCLGCVDPKE